MRKTRGAAHHTGTLNLVNTADKTGRAMRESFPLLLENQQQMGNAEELYYYEPHHLQLILMELDEYNFDRGLLCRHLSDKQEVFKGKGPHLQKVA